MSLREDEPALCRHSRIFRWCVTLCAPKKHVEYTIDISQPMIRPPLSALYPPLSLICKPCLKQQIRNLASFAQLIRVILLKVVLESRTRYQIWSSDEVKVSKKYMLVDDTT